MKTLSPLSFFTLFTGLILLQGTVLASDIHKWVGPNGEVHYGSTPPPGYVGKTQKMKIKNESTTSYEEEEPTEEQSADSGSDAGSGTESAEKKENLTPEQKAKLAETEKKNAEIRKKNCGVAKRRVAGINQGGRLYEVNEKGERHYWDDKERQKKLAEAQQSVNKWCK